MATYDWKCKSCENIITIQRPFAYSEESPEICPNCGNKLFVKQIMYPTPHVGEKCKGRCNNVGDLHVKR